MDGEMSVEVGIQWGFNPVLALMLKHQGKAGMGKRKNKAALKSWKYGIVWALCPSRNGHSITSMVFDHTFHEEISLIPT